MKSQRKFYALLLALLLVPAMAFAAWAQQSDEDVNDEEPLDAVVTIFDSGSDEDGREILDRDIESDDDPEAPEVTGKIGILAWGKGPISIKKGDIDTLAGGIYAAAEGGKIDISAGSIFSSYGIFSYLNGGSLTADTGTINADRDFGLGIRAENGGKAEFLISGGASSNTTSDSAETEDTTGGGIFAISDGISAEADNAEIDIHTDTVEAGGFGADLTAQNGGKITVDSEEISGDDTGVSIHSYGNGSEISVDSYDLYAKNIGLDIFAEENGKASVKTNDGSVIADHAVDIHNEGGTVDVNTGELEGSSGLTIRSGSGETKVTTADMLIENYGLRVNLTTPETEGEDPESTSAQSSSTSAPVAEVTINGDIANVFEAPETGEGGIEAPEEPIDPESVSPLSGKDAADTEPDEDPWTEEIEWEEDEDGWNDEPAAPGDGEEIDWDEWDPEEDISQESDPTGVASGVILNADINNAQVKVSVNGINVLGGNEMSAENAAAITFKASDTVETGYGNIIQALDGGTVEASFDKDVIAGGKAVDTFADGTGNVNVNVSEEIKSESTDTETAGISAVSMDTAETVINAGKSINVSYVAEEKDPNAIAYGIMTRNTGGKITIDAAEGLSVSGPQAVGVQLINDADFVDPDEITEVNSSGPKAAGENAPVTIVTIGQDISVKGDSNAVGAYILNRGELKLTVGKRDENTKGIIAEGNPASGMSIVSDGTTFIEVFGNVRGTDYGLSVNAADDLEEMGDDFDITHANIDILVSETISGRKQSLEVNQDQTSEQLDLTVWQIELNGSKDAALDADKTPNEDIENNIKYIVRIAPDSADKIEAVKEDGSPLETSHGYPAAKAGEKVYVKAVNDYELKGAYNGKTGKTPLQQDQNGYYLEIPVGGGVWLSVGEQPQPVVPSDGMNFYPFGDLSWLFDRELPGTGFSAAHFTPLPARPQDLSYNSTGLLLQLPTLDVMEPIVTIPRSEDGSYPVEWLDRSIGLLEQSSLPGEGITVLTGHNHMNTTEIGPFLFIRDMEEGDRIMITDEDNMMRIYRVYGNYKITSNNFASVAGNVRENALVLITCEDESVEGGYLNRRVIFAEPL